MKRKITSVYQLKIVLEGIRPQIRRQVLVPADILLRHLHNVIQIAMGWSNSHLHAFTIADVQYGIPDPDFLDDLGTEDERVVRLSDVVPEAKTLFHYQYDFGDDWQHLITVERILPADPEIHYPECLSGQRACPPDDCGGPWGYAELLKALKNPRHPDHKDMVRWAGRNFDPEAFHLEQVNRKLHRLRV